MKRTVPTLPSRLPLLALVAGCALNHPSFGWTLLDASVDSSDVMDVLDASDVFDAGDKPDALDAPDVRDVPDVPDVADASEVLDASDVPDIPDVLDVADVADVRDVPDVLDAPDVRDVPDVPDVACPTGLTRCGDTCVDTQSSLAHCGACNALCAPGARTLSAACTAGRCVLTCSPTFGNCDGVASNGCEVDGYNDRTNCGGCGLVCPGTLRCMNGVCR